MTAIRVEDKYGSVVYLNPDGISTVHFNSDEHGYVVIVSYPGSSYDAVITVASAKEAEKLAVLLLGNPKKFKA